MSLQDQLLADFSHTLTDPDGPAFLAVVAGKEMRVVLDKPATADHDPRTGVMIRRMVLYVRREDLGFQPFAGQELPVNGETWTIEEPSPHGQGVLQLGLMRYLI